MKRERKGIREKTKEDGEKVNERDREEEWGNEREEGNEREKNREGR